jgi:hypothetical protein
MQYFLSSFIIEITPHLASPLRGEGKGSKFSGERISILSDFSRLSNDALIVFLGPFAIGFTPHLASPLRGEGKLIEGELPGVKYIIRFFSSIK